MAARCFATAAAQDVRTSRSCGSTWPPPIGWPATMPRNARPWKRPSPPSTAQPDRPVAPGRTARTPRRDGGGDPLLERVVQIAALLPERSPAIVEAVARGERFLAEQTRALGDRIAESVPGLTMPPTGRQARAASPPASIRCSAAAHLYQITAPAALPLPAGGGVLRSRALPLVRALEARTAVRSAPRRRRCCARACPISAPMSGRGGHPRQSLVEAGP